MKKPKLKSSYDVGYGKPPKANQFRRGRSGNPRGRKRAEENMLSIFKRLALKRVQMKNGDRITTSTLGEAIIYKNLNAAMHGNPRAMNNIYKLAAQLGEMVDITDAKQVGRPIFVPERSKNMEEFMAQFGRTAEAE